MLIVQICEFGSDGDAEYRMHAPSRQLANLPNTTVIDCHFSHRSLPALAESADVMVFQFINDWELLSLCERRRAAGLLTVFEANDDFFDLQPWNPIASSWQDRTVQELFLKLLVSADGVQTSSDELGRRWSQCGARNVAVFHNHLIEIEELPDLQDRPLTVGWGGSPGHFADWYHIAPYLADWLKQHPEIHLAVMTHELAKPFLAIEPERYQFTRFGTLQDYLQFLRSLDIGLAPLIDTGYNRGRSDVKFLEYASRGVVGVYSDMPPYRSTVEHGITGLIGRNPVEMIEHLELLRTNPELRKRLREQAYDKVKRQRQLPDRIGERLQWYRSLLRRPIATGVPMSPAIAELADQCQDRYWQLRPRGPERALLDGMRPHDKREVVNRLTDQLTQNPNYLAAIVRIGQLLNDLRDHQQALDYLERARRLNPQSARILCEIGRTYFCQNDLTNARTFLENAVVVEPDNLPAWQYFLRFLTMTKANDGPDYARRAEQRFPDCYPLTFLAAQLYSPAESMLALTRSIERLSHTRTRQEQSVALASLRQALAVAIPLGPNLPELLPLLRNAVRLFPKSAWLASELGSALYRNHKYDEGCYYHSEAMRRQQQAMIYRDEFPNQEAPPWSWQFSNHLFQYHSLDLTSDSQVNTSRDPLK